MGIILGESPIQRDPERLTSAPESDDELSWLEYAIDGNVADVGYTMAGDEPVIESIVFAGVAGPLEFDPSSFRSWLDTLRHAIRKHEGFYR